MAAILNLRWDAISSETTNLRVLKLHTHNPLGVLVLSKTYNIDWFTSKIKIWMQDTADLATLNYAFKNNDDWLLNTLTANRPSIFHDNF